MMISKDIKADDKQSVTDIIRKLSELKRDFDSFFGLGVCDISAPIERIGDDVIVHCEMEIGVN